MAVGAEIISRIGKWCTKVRNTGVDLDDADWFHDLEDARTADREYFGEEPPYLHTTTTYLEHGRRYGRGD